MDRTKILMCLTAAAVTLVGATHLARPAHAAASATECTASQASYAQGFADGSCSGGGTLDACQQTDGGGFYFIYSCHNQH